MASASFDHSEVNRLEFDLRKAPMETLRRASVAIRKTAFDIERDAKFYAPVDTGNLKNSISTTAAGLQAEIGPTAEYGAYVEYGTSRMAPQQYMGPSFERNVPRLQDALGLAGERSIDG